MNMTRNPAAIVEPKLLLYVYGVKVRKALQTVKARLLVRNAEVEQGVKSLRPDQSLRSSCRRARHIHHSFFAS